MKKITLILIAMFAAACYAQAPQQATAPTSEMAQLRSPLPMQNPSPPVAMPIQNEGGNVVTATTVARGQVQAYLCVAGGDPRQVRLGRKLKLDNEVCDDNARDGGGNCHGADLNTFLAFQVDGRPVLIDNGLRHPATGESVLAPGQVCYVETGWERHPKVTAETYRNIGTRQRPQLDPSPDKTYTQTANMEDRNVTWWNNPVTELYFP